MDLLAQAAEAAGSSITAETILFWVFSVLAVGAAIAVVAMRNIVHAALMLVINLLAVAGLYLTLQASFLAIIQVLVYAGAIMVVFLFVIMLIGVDRDDLLTSAPGTRVAASLVAVALVGTLTLGFVGPFTSAASVCGSDAVPGVGEVACVGFDEVYAEDDASGVAFLGLRLYTRYTWPFELSALLLTVATIGAVILARRRDLAAEDVDDADADAQPGDPARPVPPETDAAEARSGAMRTEPLPDDRAEQE